LVLLFKVERQNGVCDGFIWVMRRMTQGVADSPWTDGTCESNGLSLHYLRSGEGPVLVALHGLLGSGVCLAPICQPLKASFEVVLPDARGHGRSSAPAQGYQYADMASDVIRLITALGVDKPLLVGHSMGGMTAAVVGALVGSSLGAIVLIDPTFISIEWQREVYESDIAKTHADFLNSSREYLIAAARLRNPGRSLEIIKLLVDARLQTSPFALQVLKPPNPDYRTLVAKFSVPTLLLLGDRGVVAREAAQELCLVNPHVSFEVLAGASHGMPYDVPEQIAEAILSFSRSIGIIPRLGYPDQGRGDDSH
jgi:pimeloyl-ACP methyl ester carboxylesterase